jgi:hypothetical protein
LRDKIERKIKIKKRIKKTTIKIMSTIFYIKIKQNKIKLNENV